MRVLLLAAGRSKRMQPIPDKNFLLFNGKPLIVHQIHALMDRGFDDFVIIGGKHNLEKLRQLPNKHDFGAIKFEVVEQKDLDEGMAGAVIATKDILDDEPVCIVSANDVVDSSIYRKVKEEILKADSESLIVGKKVSEYFPGGYLEVDDEGMIKSIIEKPGEGNEPSDLVNIVIHCHKSPAKLVKVIEETESNNDDRYEVALDKLIKDGSRMKALEFDGFWQPIKYPWHVFKVMEFFFENMDKQISEEAVVADTAVIKGNVIIEAGAKIFDNAVISGPAYIGRSVIVANNALVRGSMVNEGSVVGYSTEIARSYLDRDVWTHTNYIGDSVICRNVSFGSGAVTGNLRLDEGEISVNVKGEKMGTGTNKFGLICGENIRVGINTSFNPGLKIGSNTIIGPGLSIGQDIEEGKFVKGKVELEIRDNKAQLDGEKREEMKGKL
jgi:bifunctional UDP-N-acetylglucosamine pyrophosphorylase/glucosamine-1-phosphate N-acetyltransferase